MSDFSNWEKQFNNQVNLVLKTDDKIIDSAADEFKKRVEERTPVGDPSLWKWPAHSDYKPGTLKTAWQMEKSVTSATKEIKVFNLTPYGYRVEAEGWSTQAPKGMMRITALEWSDIINSVSKNFKI